jgi:hypothetical protein
LVMAFLSALKEMGLPYYSLRKHRVDEFSTISGHDSTRALSGISSLGISLPGNVLLRLADLSWHLDSLDMYNTSFFSELAQQTAEADHSPVSIRPPANSLWIVGQVEGTDCRLYWIRDPAVTGPVNWREPTGSGSRKISYPSNCWEPPRAATFRRLKGVRFSLCIRPLRGVYCARSHNRRLFALRGQGPTDTSAACALLPWAARTQPHPSRTAHQGTISACGCVFYANPRPSCKLLEITRGTLPISRPTS